MTLKETFMEEMKNAMREKNEQAHSACKMLSVCG